MSRIIFGFMLIVLIGLLLFVSTGMLLAIGVKLTKETICA